MKKVAIMQPYFFPYLGYFSLIKHTDEFILFDTAQFIRHGWIERNRILKQGEGWLYVKVPLVKQSQQTSIKDSLIDNGQQWQDKILAQLMVYKKTAPYYRQVQDLIKNILEQSYEDIVSLNTATTKAVCDYLGIDTPVAVFSNMDLKIDEPKAADEWALNICKAFGDVSEYWNPPGGKEFFERNKYEQAGIKLVFHDVVSEPYDQRRQPFEPGLSIIDAMMFNSPEEISKMLDKYELS